MSRSKGRGWAARVGVFGLLWGLSAAAAAASVNVTVSGGAVSVYPSSVTVAGTDDSLVFQLSATGYAFPASAAVVITGTGSTFRCATSANKMSVSCRKSGTGNGIAQAYQINVVPTGSSQPPAPASDIWIQSE